MKFKRKCDYLAPLLKFSVENRELVIPHLYCT